MGLLDKFTGGDKENVAQQQQQYGKTDAYGQQQQPFQQQDSNTSYGQQQQGQYGQQAQQEEKEGWSTKQKVCSPVYPNVKLTPDRRWCWWPPRRRCRCRCHRLRCSRGESPLLRLPRSS